MIFIAKLRKLGKEAEKQIVQLKAQGMSSYTIADKLKEQYGVSIDPSNVTRFLNKRFMYYRSQAAGVEQARDEAAEMLKLMYSDMRLIRDELFDLLRELRQTHNVPEMKSVLAELSKHINRMNNILSKSQITEVKEVNITDISTRIPKILRELEERGYIEIKKNIPVFDEEE